MSYIPFPNISPEIFSVTIGGVTLALRWYALGYIAGLLAGWKLIEVMLARPALWAGPAPMPREAAERLLTWVIIGVILGGRIGYVLFYQPSAFLQNPASIFFIWQGGMAFHGGFLGVVVAGLWFARAAGVPALTLGDLMAAVAPIGIFLVRIANFINAELWGRPTDLPWGVAFPGDAAQACGQAVGAVCARHPSQVYEAILEGAVLFAALTYLIWRKGWLRRPGAVMGLFLAGYGAARFAVEFVRQPDAQFITDGNPIGLALHIGGWGLTMGQLLSLPMILAGLWFLARARRGKGLPA
jgi:phosphatidylglycerol---prolipoprotein diacylglyceryl transferase